MYIIRYILILIMINNVIMFTAINIKLPKITAIAVVVIVVKIRGRIALITSVVYLKIFYYIT